MRDDFSFVAEPGKPDLVMRRQFDASAADLFDAWTQAEQVAQWWDPTGQPLDVCEIDLRPGGRFRWINQGETGRNYPFTGVYREIERPVRLVFHTGPSPDDPKQISTLVFDERDGTTELTITIQCRSAAERDEMLAMRIEIGTAKTLQNLAAHLQRGAA